MKAFKTILLITGVLVAGLAFNSVAQTHEKEKSDKEMYAFKHDKRHKHKDKTDKIERKAKDKDKPHSKHKFHKNRDKRLFKAKARKIWD